MKRLAAVLAVCGTCVSAMGAQAAITVLTGSNVAVTTENLLFSNSPPNGFAVQGITDPSSVLVNFTGVETLVGNGGQASLEAFDGAFGQVSWILDTPNTGYTGLTFNIGFPNDDRGPPNFGTITITVLNQFGVTTVLSNSQLASNGLNDFQAYATLGDLITQVTLTGTPWTSVQQVRFGGIETISTAVPELSTWSMMLIGFAGFGFMAYRRAKRLPASA